MHPVLHPGWGYDVGIQIDKKRCPMKNKLSQFVTAYSQSPTDGGTGPYAQSPTDGGTGPYAQCPTDGGTGPY